MPLGVAQTYQSTEEILNEIVSRGFMPLGVAQERSTATSIQKVVL